MITSLPAWLCWERECDEFDALRQVMVDEQICGRGVRDPRVLEAMRRVPRHRFVPAERLSAAYDDAPVAIGEGQTISQPYVVASMTEALELAGSDRVLEVGAGSGYQAAVLSRLAHEVIAVEALAPLADAARERLANLGCDNVRVELGDGTLGCPDAAPFDAILVAAAAPSIPPPLLEQLAEGGRLVIPVGLPEVQTLIRVRKAGGRTQREPLYACCFVPLRGLHGWAVTAAQ